MIVPVPTSTTVGQKLTSPFWNTEVAAALTFLLNPPTCSAHSSSPVSLSAGAFTSIPVDTEDWDTDSIHPIGSSSRMTISTPGIYICTANMQFSFNATGRRGVQFAINGVGALGRAIYSPAPSSFTDVNLSRQFQLSAGDYVECQAFQDATGSPTLTVSLIFDITRLSN